MDLRYKGFEITEGTVPMNCGLPQAKGDCETLVLTLEQPVSALAKSASSSSWMQIFSISPNLSSIFCANKAMSASICACRCFSSYSTLLVYSEKEKPEIITNKARNTMRKIVLPLSTTI